MKKLRLLVSSMAVLLLSFASNVFAQTDITSVLGDQLSGWQHDDIFSDWNNGGATSPNPGNQDGSEYKAVTWEIWTATPKTVDVGRPIYKEVVLLPGSYTLKAAVQTAAQKDHEAPKDASAVFFAGDAETPCFSMDLKYRTVSFTLSETTTIAYGIKFKEVGVANWSAIGDLTLTTTSYSSAEDYIKTQKSLATKAFLEGGGVIPTNSLNGWTATNRDGENFQVNTWSGEGATDGSNMITPFIENWRAGWTGSLKDKDIKYNTIECLPEGWYEISGLLRACKEGGFSEGDGPKGIYITINEDEYCITDNAVDCTNGSYSQLSKAIYVGSEGNLDICIKLRGVNVNWVCWKDFTVKKAVLPTDADIAAVWAEMPATKCDANLIAAAEALHSSVSASKSPKEFASLKEAVEACKLSAQGYREAYAQVAEALPKLDEAFAKTNVYTPEAWAAYLTKKAAYENQTMTIAEAKAFSAGSGWHSANYIDDVLLSAWTIGGEQCKDYDTRLYINTWSVEGNNDGSNFRVPFLEYWVDNANSLAANTLQAKVGGLMPDKLYNLTAWTRVQVKKDETTPKGITLQVGDSEPIDVCTGDKVGADLFHKKYVVSGKADERGVLTITYNVASDNNVSWLSFKDLWVELAPVDIDVAVAYNEDKSACTITATPAAEDNMFLYSTVGFDDWDTMEAYEAPIELAWDEAKADEQGKCTFTYYFSELGSDLESIGTKKVEVVLNMHRESIEIETAYNEDNSLCTLTAAPTKAEGTMLYYAYEEDGEPQGMFEDGKAQVAWTPGMAAEDGTCKFEIYVYEVEVDEEFNMGKVVAQGFEEIILNKPYEPQAGDAADNAIALADGWSEVVAAAEVGADKAGMTHFTYTAEADGTFVFSCGYEIKQWAEGAALEAVEASAGVRYAYGKEVKAGDVVEFAAYLPQGFTGEQEKLDEEGNPVVDEEGNPVMVEVEVSIDEFMFYAGVQGEPSAPELPIFTEYNHDNSVCVVSSTTTQEGTSLVISIDGGEEFMELTEEGYTVSWLEALADEQGICIYNIVVREVAYDEEFNMTVVSEGTDQVHLSQPIPMLELEVAYNEDNSSCIVTAEPSEEGTQMLISIDGGEEFMELPAKGYQIAWLESLADEQGICTYDVIVREIKVSYDEDLETEVIETVMEGFEQVKVSKPLPVLEVETAYNEDSSACVITAQPTEEGTQMLISIDGGEEWMELPAEGYAVAWTPGAADDQGICIYNIIVREQKTTYDEELEMDVTEIIIEGNEQVHLAKPIPVVAIDVNYNDDNSYCKVFAWPTEEGTQILYAFEEDATEFEGEIPATGLELAWTPGMADESGICKWTIYATEVKWNEDYTEYEVICTGVEEISLAKQLEPLAGNSAEEPIVLADGWSEPIAAAEIGADEAGMTHFKYTAEADGLFVFSCGNEIKAWAEGAALEAVEATAGVRYAYGKDVKAGDVVEFAAYLPQVFYGEQEKLDENDEPVLDENGNPVMQEVEVAIDQYIFYAGVEAAAVVVEPAELTAEMFCRWDGFGADANVTEKGVGEYHIGESSGLPYGHGNVEGSAYADISAWNYLALTVAEGTPRLLLNRQGMDNSGDFIEINGNVGMDYVTIVGNVWYIDLAKIVAEAGYAHLNCIKDANWANCTITEAKLVMEIATPVEPAELELATAYNEDNTMCTITVEPVAGGTLYYSYDGFEEEAMLYEGSITCAYTGNEATFTYNLTVREYDEAMENILAEGFEQIILSKPYEPMAGDAADNAIALATGWSEPIAAAEVGADEAGMTHFTYTAEADGQFVFSCGYEIKAWAEGAALEAVESTAGVRYAYGKEVKAGEVVAFAAYLPQGFIGEQEKLDENGEPVLDENGNPVMEDVDVTIAEYQFYANVEAAAVNLELLVNGDFTDGTNGWDAVANGGNFAVEVHDPVTVEAYAGWGNLDLTDFSLSQKVTLQPGTYQLSAYAFYRYGVSYDVDPSKSCAQLFAGDDAVDVVTLGGIELDTYANSMAEASAAFAQGLYLNTLEFVVTEEKEIEVGIKGAHELKQSWFIAGPFSLIYIGEPITDTNLPESNILANGNAGGKYGDVACAWGKENQGNPHAADIEVVDGTHAFVVHATAKAADPWDNQFWICAPTKFYAGDKVKISFRYKAAKAASVGTQAHCAPSDYNHWACIGTVGFTTEWQEFSAVVDVTTDHQGSKVEGSKAYVDAKGFQSVAFNLNDFEEANDYYFDDIVWEVISDEGTKKHEEAVVGINGIAADVKAAGIYTVGGQKVETLQKGLNIVIDENGAAKKVYIK